MEVFNAAVGVSRAILRPPLSSVSICAPILIASSVSVLVLGGGHAALVKSVLSLSKVCINVDDLSWEYNPQDSKVTAMTKNRVLFETFFQEKRPGLYLALYSLSGFYK